VEETAAGHPADEAQSGGWIGSVLGTLTNRIAGQIVADIGNSIGGSMGGSIDRAIVRGALGGILRQRTGEPHAIGRGAQMLDWRATSRRSW
jgi:hypothetical protein